MQPMAWSSSAAARPANPAPITTTLGWCRRRGSVPSAAAAAAAAEPPGGACRSDSGAGSTSRTMPKKVRPPTTACISTPASSATLHTLARIDAPSRMASAAALRPSPGRRGCGPPYMLRAPPAAA